jgi:hypothetical protein
LRSRKTPNPASRSDLKEIVKNNPTKAEQSAPFVQGGKRESGENIEM